MAPVKTSWLNTPSPSRSIMGHSGHHGSAHPHELGDPHDHPFCAASPPATRSPGSQPAARLRTPPRSCPNQGHGLPVTQSCRRVSESLSHVLGFKFMVFGQDFSNSYQGRTSPGTPPACIGDGIAIGAEYTSGQVVPRPIQQLTRLQL